jgi:hypothetical protein
MSVDEALSSWNDGAARRRIVEFVRQVGDPASPHPSLCLLLNHDDAEREYAYESHAATRADAEPILTTAARLGWTVVSMRRDFRTVFAPAADAPPP